MSVSSTGAPNAARAKDNFYIAAWRWHFYAGLYVVPFLLMLAVTGTVMVYANIFEDRFGLDRDVTPAGQILPVEDQAMVAVQALPGGSLVQYIAPADGTRAGIFNVKSAGKNYLVAVNPYDGQVIGSVIKGDSLYALMDDIHGTLLLGDLGDRMIEIAASLGLILVVTGLYMWWPRGNGGWKSSLMPNLSARGRDLWMQLHGVVGIWMSVILVLFLITGLAWAGIWGGKMMQAWSSFPAEKWDNVPLSDDSHITLNDSGVAGVPWALEQTPLPLSRDDAGTAIGLNRITAYARTLGFDEQYRINLPGNKRGVYTISADSMDGDTTDPMGDRTVHIDQYTGEVLAEANFEGYSPFAKFMAVGTAFHMGYMGLWNVALNVVFCLAMVFLAVSGLVMWWKRRPAAGFRLLPPQMPTDLPMWKGAVAIMLVLSLAFPMAGITLAVIMMLDLLLIGRLPALARMVR